MSEKVKPKECECSSGCEPCYFIGGDWYCNNCMPSDAPGDVEPYDTPALDVPIERFTEASE